MPGPTIDSFLQVTSPLGVPAIAMLGPNKRVFGQFGPVGTAVDLVTFGLPFLFANWTAPNTRTFACGVAMVGQSSQGIAYIPNVPPPPPIAPSGVPLVTAANTRLIST
jgi:hypothetical protein